MPKTSMLNALDHIVLLASNFDATIRDYELLFGAQPVRQSHNTDFNIAVFQSANTALEIVSPVDSSDAKIRVNEILKGRNSALTSLAFAVDDISTAHDIFARRGLKPGTTSDGTSVNMRATSTQKIRRFRCDDTACHGVKTFIMETSSSSHQSNMQNGLCLDHLVINTPNPERAIAHYGAKLGIRFALDRQVEQFGVRFLFFKLDDLVLEVIHKLGTDQNFNEPDDIWGLTWKVDDLRQAHKRLCHAGLTVSEIRAGRKPGTTVFTVKSHTTGIPTLFLSQSEKP